MKAWDNISRNPKKSVRDNSPIFHRWKWMEWKYDQLLKLGKKFKTPEELTIITVHNYKEKPYLIKGLDLLGLTYIVLTPSKEEWKSVYKISTVLGFLKTATKTKYVLCCDARDVLIMNDPQLILDKFKNKFSCNLLFNSTMHSAWACMPEIFEWTKTVAKKGGRYLNAGVYIGEWDFIIEVLEEAFKYVTEDALTHRKYFGYGASKREKLFELLPDFPKGTYSDQDIFRYIHPKFYPRMDIDYTNEITYRN